MNTLPPEIWSHIFRHACVDTGYTGCSISETCRFFNDVGKSTKFRSVALQGLSQIISFRQSTKSLPSYHLQIENMYIFASKYNADIDEERLPLPLHRGSDTVDNSSFSTLIDVIAAAAPSLIYLYLCLEMTRETIFLPIDFPHLSELVVYGQYNDHGHTKIGGVPTMMNLRRLRISNPAGFGDDKAIAAIPACAPYLTHLRLDRHTVYSTTFISAVQDTLQLSPTCQGKDPHQSYDAGDLKFPSSLKRLLIHPGRIYRPMCGFGAMNMQRAQWALDCFVRSDPRIFLYEHDQEGDKDIQADSLKEWLDRTNGKLAYWKEK